MFTVFLQLCICLSTQCLHGQGRGATKQNVDRRGQWGKGKITGKTMRISFMDDPCSQQR